MKAGTLSAAPLLAYVESVGGIGAVVDTEEAHYEAGVKALERARETGAMTVVAADEFACKVLGLHPCLIWPEWFGLGPFSDDTLARVVAEDKIGRFIREDEQVLVLDGNPENLDPANLSVVPKGRPLSNYGKHLRKLTPKQVEEIRSYPTYHGGRREKGKGVVDMLAEKYGVSRHTIIDARRNKDRTNYMDIGKKVRQEVAA